MKTADLRAWGLRSVTIEDRDDHARVEAHTIADPRSAIVIEDRDIETCLDRLEMRMCPFDLSGRVRARAGLR